MQKACISRFEGSKVVIDQFWRLCEDAHRLAETTVFSNEREPSFVPILNFVKEHPEHREALAYCFMTLFHCDDLGPYEIIEYCMRELRWQEVHDYFAGIASVTPDINWRAVAKRLLEAYYDPWPSAGIYERYPLPESQQAVRA